MAIERVADTGPLQWILQAHGVPLVFERYCQVYYPYIERLTAAGDASPAAMRFRLVRWREIAELLGEERLKREEGVTYRPGFRMTYLPRPTPAYVGPMPGELPDTVYKRLVAALVPFTGDKACFFYSFVQPPASLREEDRHLYRGTLADIVRLATPPYVPASPFQRTKPVETLPVPEFWWPADRIWCVNVDIDSPSALIGGPNALIATLLEDQDLEAYEVHPTAVPYPHWVRSDGAPW